ncbi:hypothetical protein [Chryseobacterium sp. MP_3.2]|uniref:hypothetical protein n=1 Tax=Chryseobacterium sp. MP_3.2 TaxID=3071712 RepID=UPI002E001CC0|nr:hypothetical protein [Chryseobacterium sp. MP_3.2]
MKSVLFLILILISNNIFSQNNDPIRSSIGPEKFDKLKADFEILSKTDFYKDLEDTKILYMSKVQFVPTEANKTDEKFAKWITENIITTKFETVEEALILRQKLNKLEEQLKKKHPDIYDLMKRINVEQRTEIKN